MKLPRLITRRRVKWVTTLFTLLLSSVFMASIWSHAGYTRDDGDSGGYIAVTRGTVWLVWWRWSGPKSGNWTPTGFSHGWLAKSQVNWRPVWETTAYPAAGGMPSYFRWRGGAPLWPLLLPLLLLSAYLWRTNRRAKPWQCAKCRYDLRGLDGGVCPECGEAS